MNTIKEFLHHVDSTIHLAKPDVREQWEGLKREIAVSEANRLSKVNSIDTSKVSRVEVIDNFDHKYINWDDRNIGTVWISMQDEGRTVKIFINSLKPQHETASE